MARTVIGYTAEGAKVWSENSPSSTAYFDSNLLPRGDALMGGSALEARPPQRPHRKSEDRDRRAESVKGWETRRAK